MTFDDHVIYTMDIDMMSISVHQDYVFISIIIRAKPIRSSAYWTKDENLVIVPRQNILNCSVAEGTSISNERFFLIYQLKFGKDIGWYAQPLMLLVLMLL